MHYPAYVITTRYSTLLPIPHHACIMHYIGKAIKPTPNKPLGGAGIMPKQNSKVAPATTAPATAAANTPSTLYVVGPKVANCRTTHTQLGWQAITTLLQKQPKGATMAQLIAVVTPNTQFAWYAYKNGWLAVAA